jgi:predicted transcriptional regulator of viral defense system
MKKRSLAVALTRLEKTGLIRRVSRGWICIQPCEMWEIIRVVYPSSYISLEWALHHHEILDQAVHTITLIWLGKPKVIKIKHYIFELHRIKPQLHFGYDVKMIAEPEKALLDTIYIRGKLPSELNLETLNPKKISTYSKKYPKTIQKYIDKKILPSKTLTV